ncbi:hypothetical protein BJF79_15460 [Actinomadura sp. CNU-125]|uniref:hypothetical protein n=1 Tax=Actinomadura sp. CNU-125 TaxID=1904961 RepID=UPI00095EABFC|nr:hypothetical protein [Actinomadura sp. CNU-125]OLT21662.1 hypothetical protein BJF79_15460 [Actinomadura sp. CNU-125]
MSGGQAKRPAWWRPGMTDAEARIWEAAERAADSAPEIRRGDDVHLKLRPLLAGWLTTPPQETRDAA